MAITLTDREWFLFAGGMALGGRLSTPIKTGNKIVVNNSTNTEPVKVNAKEAISIHVGVVKGDRGSVATVPLFISNNNVNNNGVGLAGFLADLHYDTSMLDYQGYTLSLWDGSVVVDTTQTSSGRVRFQGLRTPAQGNTLENMVLLNLQFLVKSTADETSAMANISLRGSAGSGQGTELLIIRPEYEGYMFITPFGMFSGGISLVALDPPPVISTPLPSPGNVLVGGGGSTTTVDFTLRDIELIGVVGLGSGGVIGNLVFYVGGRAVGNYTFPLTLGKNTIKGKLPIILPPGVSWEDVTVELEIIAEEGDDTPYYVFIPAFGFEMRIITEVADEDSGSIPRQPIILAFMETLRLQDVYEVTMTTGFRDIVEELNMLDVYEVFMQRIEPPVNVDDIMDTVVIQDIYDSTKISVVSYDSQIDSLVMEDIVLIEGKLPPSQDADDIVDSLGLEDFHVVDLRSGITPSAGVDEFSLGDFHKISTVQPFHRHFIEEQSIESVFLVEFE